MLNLSNKSNLNQLISILLIFYIQIQTQINTLDARVETSTKIENLLLEASTSTSLPNGFIGIGTSVKSEQTDDPLKPKSNSTLTFITNQNYTNFATVIGNNSQPGLLGMSRNIASQSINNPQASSSSSSTLILILVSLVVVSCIIAIVLTALFVMRRRFTIWRLNGSKSNSNGCNDGAHGVLTNTSSSENGSEINEKDPNLLKNTETVQVQENQNESLITSVENKEAMLQLNQNQIPTSEAGHANEAVEINKNELEVVKEGEKVAQTIGLEMNQDQEQQQVNNANSNAHHTLTEQSSSTSLIVNVLNELSESVASKLASKSPGKSTSNLNTVDPEKQPLNNE